MPTTAETRSGQYVDFDEYVDFHLNKVRKNVKTTDLLTALAGVAAMVLGYLLVFVVCDHWIVEGGFGRTARIVMLLGLVFAATAWVVWKVVLPARRRVTALYAADVIERAEPELEGNLRNLIDLRAAGRGGDTPVTGTMEKRAALRMAQIDLDETIDRRRLLHLSYVLAAVVVLFCAYVMFSPKRISTSLWRALVPTSSVGVSTRTSILEVLPGDAEILARSQLEVTVDITGEEPKSVTLLFTTADQRFVDEPLELREDEEFPKRYVGTIVGENARGILQDLDYRIVAGDATSDTYHVTVVQPPSATITEVTITPPAYMGLEPRTRQGGHADGWEGSTLEWTATTNQPVERAMIQFGDDESFSTKAEELRMTVGPDGRTLTARLPDWEKRSKLDVPPFPKYYRVQVWNDRGDVDPEPTAYRVRMKLDLPPEVFLVDPTEDLVGPLARPANGRVPLTIRAKDDFGVRSLRLKVAKEGETIYVDPIDLATESNVYAPAEPFDLQLHQPGRLELEPGEVIEVSLQARDNKHHGDDWRPQTSRETTPLRIEIAAPADPEQLQNQRRRDEQRRQERLDEHRRQNGDEAEAVEQPGGEEGNPRDGEPGEGAREGRPGEDANPREGDPQPGEGDPRADGGNPERQPGDPAERNPENNPGERPEDIGDRDPDERQSLDNEGRDDDLATQEIIERLNRERGDQPRDPMSDAGDTPREPANPMDIDPTMGDTPETPMGRNPMDDPAGDRPDREPSGDPPTGDPPNDPANPDPMMGDPMPADPTMGDPMGDPSMGDPMEGMGSDPMPGAGSDTDTPKPGESPMPGENPMPGDPGTNPPQPGMGTEPGTDPPTPGMGDPMPGDPMGDNPMPGDSDAGTDQPGERTGGQPKPGAGSDREREEQLNDEINDLRQLSKDPEQAPKVKDDLERLTKERDDLKKKRQEKMTPEQLDDEIERLEKQRNGGGEKQPGDPDSPEELEKEIDDLEELRKDKEPGGDEPMPGMGDPMPGDPMRGDPGMGEPMPGDMGMGMGGTEPGPGMGDPMPGDPGAGNPEPGDDMGPGQPTEPGMGEPMPGDVEGEGRPGDPNADAKPTPGEVGPDGMNEEGMGETAPGQPKPGDADGGRKTDEQLDDEINQLEQLRNDPEKREEAEGELQRLTKERDRREMSRRELEEEIERLERRRRNESRPTDPRPGDPKNREELDDEIEALQKERDRRPEPMGGDPMGGDPMGGEPMPGEPMGGDPMGQPQPGMGDPMGQPMPGEGDPMPGAGQPMPGAGQPMPGAGEPQPGGEGAQPGAGAGQPEPNPNGNPAGGDVPNGGGAQRRNADGAAGGGTAPPAASDPDVDSARKATELVLDELEGQLKRGDVDEDLLDRLGWTEADLAKYVDRMKQRFDLLDQPEAPAPESEARKRQFEEMLKSLDFRSTGEKLEAREDRRRSVDGFGGRDVPAPAEYREAADAFSRALPKLFEESKPKRDR